MKPINPIFMSEAKKPISLSERTVETIMIPNVFAISLQMTVKEAILLLVEKRIGGAPVVDNSLKVVSVVSEGDLLKLAAFSGLDKKIGACVDKLVKSDKLITIKKTDSVTDAYKLFLANAVHRLIVADDNGKLQGIVSRSNILKVFVDAGGVH